MKNPNWRGIQAYGCMTPDFSPPKDVSIYAMSGGSLHADLHKEGTKYRKSSGGQRKRTGKAKLRFGVGIYKTAIFNTVVLKIPM